jgi:hypothetical protein
MEFGRFAAENRAIREKANQKRSTSSGSRTSAERSQRQVHADTKDPPGSDDGNSESHQRRSAKALALLNPRTGKMAQESGSGIPELSLGTGQLPHHAEVQDTRNKPLAPGAQAQEPEG